MLLLPRKIQAGYTLMEVLVVVAIIGILAGAGVATYAKFRERQMVEQAAMNFANELRKVQKRADAGERPTGCDPAEKLIGYKVSVVGQTGLIQALCHASPVNSGSISLSNDAVFDNNMEITFQTIGQGVDVTVDGDTIIRNNNSNYKYQVTVEAGGVITVEKIL